MKYFSPRFRSKVFIRNSWQLVTRSKIEFGEYFRTNLRTTFRPADPDIPEAIFRLQDLKCASWQSRTSERTLFWPLDGTNLLCVVFFIRKILKRRRSQRYNAFSLGILSLPCWWLSRWSGFFAWLSSFCSHSGQISGSSFPCWKTAESFYWNGIESCTLRISGSSIGSVSLSWHPWAFSS